MDDDDVAEAIAAARARLAIAGIEVELPDAPPQRPTDADYAALGRLYVDSLEGHLDGRVGPGRTARGLHDREVAADAVEREAQEPTRQDCYTCGHDKCFHSGLPERLPCTQWRPQEPALRFPEEDGQQDIGVVDTPDMHRCRVVKPSVGTIRVPYVSKRLGGYTEAELTAVDYEQYVEFQQKCADGTLLAQWLDQQTDPGAAPPGCICCDCEPPKEDAQ